MGFIFKKREFLIDDSGIDSVEEVTLGNVKQTILIQAQDPTNPVLVFLHGGPCMPIPGVVSRGQDYAIATTTKELVGKPVLVVATTSASGLICCTISTVDGIYDYCMSVSKVKGFWRPLEGANPFKGEIGELCEAEEMKVEFTKLSALPRLSTIPAVKLI